MQTHLHTSQHARGGHAEVKVADHLRGGGTVHSSQFPLGKVIGVQELGPGLGLNNSSCFLYDINIYNHHKQNYNVTSPWSAATCLFWQDPFHKPSRVSNVHVLFGCLLQIRKFPVLEINIHMAEASET